MWRARFESTKEVRGLAAACSTANRSGGQGVGVSLFFAMFWRSLASAVVARDHVRGDRLKGNPHAEHRVAVPRRGAPVTDGRARLDLAQPGNHSIREPT